MALFTGTSVSSAINKGMHQMHLNNKSNVKISVVQTAKKGFLGFGKQDAKISIVKSLPKKSKKKTIHNSDK